MKSLLSLKKYFLRYKFKLLLGVLFILLSDLAQVFIPIFFGHAIDLIKNSPATSDIINAAIWIVGAAFVSGIFRYLIRQTIIVVSREIEYDLRQDFWTHLQTLSMRYFQNHSTGDLMAHSTNDLSAVRMFVGPAVMYSIDTLLKGIMIISIMFTIDWELTVYSLLPLPFLSYLVYKISTKIHTHFMKIQEKFSELTTKAQESFSGIRVIKSYVRGESEVRAFDKLGQEYLDRNMDKIRVQSLFMPILFLITGLSPIVIIWIGGIKIINNILTLGDLTSFILYLGLLAWPIIAFGWVANIVQQGAASMKRLNVIFNEKPDIVEPEHSKYADKNIGGNIEFKNVSFRYSKKLPWVFKNINLNIKKGETVALIGKTGVGKSSFINLIPRLYDTIEGEVLVDGINVKDYPFAVLREAIGMVPQETFLFSDTLRNNILYGVKDPDKVDVENICEISQLSKDIDDFNDGYETILGERGITLSGGQKQRTSLSRALAVDPKILILDDAFSAVDTNTEEQILTRLREFMRDRTSVIISHRISTVKDCDRIYVLDQAQIAEEGTHDELVAANGLYAELYQKQLLEEELNELS